MEPAAATAHDRRALIIFSVGGRDFCVGDVLQTLPQRTDGSAAVAGADRVDDADVEATLDAWRYQRDLISAEECEAWLAQRGLGYADLLASMERRLRRAAPADDDAAEIDALLDASFDEHARELARHAALACENRWRWPQPAESLVPIWHHWQAAASAHCAQAFDLAERARELATRAGELTRVDYTEVELDSAAALREARLCVLEDRITLTEVAAAAGFPWRAASARLGELPAPLAQALEHAAPGQLCVPATDDGRFLLLQLHERAPPSPDDPAVTAAIDARLRQRLLDALVCRHVQWTWPLHHE